MKSIIKQKAKYILITGATSGIGNAIACCFAKEGWNILCHYYSSEIKANKLKKSIQSFGVKCELIKANFVKKKELEKFINRIKKRKIDTLINNAGTCLNQKYFTNISLQDIHRTFMINAFVPFVISSAVFIKMKRNNFGRIVNISSIAAKYGGSAYSMHYGCSKRALEGITKTLSKEGASCNVLVNTVRPGVIDTDFHKKFPKDMQERIKIIPLKRMGQVEEVADMVFFLSSDKNTFITNQTIGVSGGE